MNRILISAGFLLASAGAASAQDIIATFNGVGPGESVSISRDAGGSYSGTSAGQFQWTRTGGSAASPTGNYVAFCIELDQHVGGGGSYMYNIVATELAPQPFPPSSPMGVARAEALARLWNNHFADSFNSNSEAAAFQLCVWEIVFNDDLNFGMTTGLFRATAGGSTIATADSWLVGLDTGPMASIFALSSNEALGNAQDMLVPTPGAAALMGIGGLVAMRRKR